MRLLLSSLLLFPLAAAAAEPVDVALVLVTDVSRSIDDSEYQVEKQGYATAFSDPNVIAAIRAGAVGAIAVEYVEFAGLNDVRTVLDWTIIHDEASAKAFVDRLVAAPRSFAGRTSISAGIDHAVRDLAETSFEPARRVIDVCGDGTNNSGRDVTAARDDAVAASITINGLTIINDHPVAWAFAHVQPPGGLTNYYREHVIGGPGAFVLEVHDFQSFGAAMTRKLINEVASRGQLSIPPT
jgi:hypothetical protein